MKRYWLLICVLLVAASVLAGCVIQPVAVTPAPATQTEQGGPIRIGMVNFLLGAAYFAGMSEAVQQEAAYYGNVEVIVTDANMDAEKMTSDIEDVLAQNVDGIIISGGPLEALPAGLDAIEKAGVPVVLVDRLLKGGNYTSWIGPHNYQIGTQDGLYIADRLGGEGHLVVLRGGPADNTIGLDRTNGMLSEVEKTNIQVTTAPNFGGWSEDGGFTLMEDMLAKHDQIDAVFCENDSMCLGAQKAIGDAGRSEEMFLCGVDGQKEALVAIMEGTNYACTGLNDSDQIGRAAFHRLMAILAGANPEKDTILPSPIITIDNAGQHYDPNSVF